MFGSKKSNDDTSSSKKQPVEGNLSIIAAGTVIDGDLYSEGDIRVEGQINGTVSCRSRIVVGANGIIYGNVDAMNATVAGQINGSVVVRKAIQLQETGKINGDILTESLTIMAGGHFTGNILMGDTAVSKIAKLPQPSHSNKGKAPAALPTSDDAPAAKNASGSYNAEPVKAK